MKVISSPARPIRAHVFPDDLVLPVELADHRIAGSKQVPVAQILALPTALLDVDNLTVHINHVSKLTLAEVAR